MKKILFIVILTIVLFTNISFAQYLFQSKELNLQKPFSRNSPFTKMVTPSVGSSGGFNVGVGSIEGEVAFAIGAFAEIKTRDISFIPQTNYWKAKKQNNFELAGLIRFYFSRKSISPYIDGGLGVNFYKSEKSDFTKMSILAGGGFELPNISSSFNLLFDGKYKLIVNDGGNISSYIFTAGLKFPFK